MTARTNVQSNAGALLAISAGRPLTFDAAGYADTDIAWTTVGEVEDWGEHGVTANIIEFTAVNDAVVQKLKGSKNYGTKTLTLGHVPSDAGQTLLAAAAESPNRYSARLTYPLGDGEVTPEIHYLDVLVASRTINDGNSEAVRRSTVALAICKREVVVSAT